MGLTASNKLSENSLFTNNQDQQKPSMSLFGNNNNQTGQSQTVQSGGLFGNVGAAQGNVSKLFPDNTKQDSNTQNVGESTLGTSSLFGNVGQMGDNTNKNTSSLFSNLMNNALVIVHNFYLVSYLLLLFFNKFIQ